MANNQMNTGASAGSSGSLNEDLRRLSDLDDFEVADGYPNLKGWDVKTPDGQTLGKVDDLIVSVSEMRVRYLDVDIDRSLASGVKDAVTPAGAEEGHALVPIGAAQLDDAKDDVVVSGLSSATLGQYPRYQRGSGISRQYESSIGSHLAGGAAAAGAAAAVPDYGTDHYDDQRLFGKARGRGAQRATAQGATAQGEQRLTLSEEQLNVGKRQVQAGEVAVEKHVETEHVREQVELRREEVSIERHALPPDARMDDATIGEKEIRVPLRAEEAVVEKRVVPREEIIIRKNRVSTPQTVEADLRRERLDVENDVTTGRAAGGVAGATGAAGLTGTSGASHGTGGSLADKARNAIDDVKDRVDGNPASKPGLDPTDRR